MNEGQKIIWEIIFQAFGGWQFDDDNQTGTPSTSTSLNANADITLPSGALTIRGIEITDPNSVTKRLIPLTFEEIQSGIQAFGEFMKTDNVPVYYCPVGDTILLKPQLSSSAGSYTYRIYYDRGSVEFAYNATTTVPGFITEFHMALAVYAALVFAKSRPNGMKDRIATLQESWNNYLSAIRRTYSKRWSDLFPSKINRGDPISDYI